MSNRSDRPGRSDTTRRTNAGDEVDAPDNAEGQLVPVLPVAGIRYVAVDDVDVVGYVKDQLHGLGAVADFYVRGATLAHLGGTDRVLLSDDDEFRQPTAVDAIAGPVGDGAIQPPKGRRYRLRVKLPRAERSAAKKAASIAKIDELLATSKSRPPKEFDPKAPMPF